LGLGLAPRQLGCGVPLGCEAAAHAARLYLQNMPPNHLLLKLDFKNAFNTLRRDKMLESVKEYAPELFTFIHAAYGQASLLFCGDHILESAEGVQQGDPLGPLLFCLTIQSLILKLQSEFNVFYLNDGTIGGSVEDVIHDLQLVEDEAGLAGLKLNHAKSELICDDVCARDAVMSAFSGLQVIAREQATLLGTPIGSVDLINSILTLKLEKLKLMGERLQHLSCQDALLILRHSLAIPKVLYILRTAPCFLSDQLEAFDGVLRSILSQVLNINLSQEMAWMQASLPSSSAGTLCLFGLCCWLLFSRAPDHLPLFTPIPILKLPLPIGAWAIWNHLHHLPIQCGNAFGIHLILQPRKMHCWNRLQMTNPKLALWLLLVLNQVLG
jgi:hypothetical protein